MVLERAGARGITPLTAAEELVVKRLAEARDGPGHFVESSDGGNHRQPGDTRGVEPSTR